MTEFLCACVGVLKTLEFIAHMRVTSSFRTKYHNEQQQGRMNFGHIFSFRLREAVKFMYYTHTFKGILSFVVPLA